MRYKDMPICQPIIENGYKEKNKITQLGSNDYDILAEKFKEYILRLIIITEFLRYNNTPTMSFISQIRLSISLLYLRCWLFIFIISMYARFCNYFKYITKHFILLY